MSRHKYPRTAHLPFSQGRTSDDLELASLNGFVGKTIVITEKMDGENSTLYRDHYHARSLDSKHHPSRDWLKAFWGNIAYQIPEGWRICGENMYARHSIAYDNLESYFYGFSIWDENNIASSWPETVMWLSELGIALPPVLYTGKFDIAVIKATIKALDPEKQEGIVVRVAEEIHYDDFDKYVAKWVRPQHVQTDDHWMHQAVVPNKLAS